MAEISIADLAYTAGIVDGEGCILVSHQPTRYKGHNPERIGVVYRSYYCRVAVSMTDSVVVPWLYKNFGGSLCRDKIAYRGSNALFENRWIVATGDAEPFLRAIYPYLKLKQRQAKIALRFCVLKRLAAKARAKNNPRSRGSHATPVSFQRQFGLCKQQIVAERARLKAA